MKPKNRYASLLDLNNYFKIKDLLGGLTESQQAQLRKNIGISGGDIFDNITVNSFRGKLNSIPVKDNFYKNGDYIIIDNLEYIYYSENGNYSPNNWNIVGDNKSIDELTDQINKIKSQLIWNEPND